MKNTDISKVKVGDLWVRGEGICPAVVVKVNEKSIDLYLPESTENYGANSFVKVLDNWKIRVRTLLLQEEMFDNDDFYFEC
jgi:hypothetical protein